MEKQKRISFNHFEKIIKSFKKKSYNQKDILHILSDRIFGNRNFERLILIYFQKEYIFEDIIKRYKQHPFKSISKSTTNIKYNSVLKLSYMFCIKDGDNLIRTKPEDAEYINIKLSIRFDGAKNDSRLHRMLIKI